MPEAIESSPSGRPRDPTTDRAIYDACIQLLSAEGFPSTTIDAVASLSGVSRPTIYRRYANKNEMIESCIEEILSKDVPTITATDDPMRDVLELLDNTSHLLTETPIGGILRNALPYVTNHKFISDIFNRVAARRRATLKKALQRASDAGLLDKSRDIEVLIDGLVGPIYLRFITMQGKVGKPYTKKLLKALTGYEAPRRRR